MYSFINIHLKISQLIYWENIDTTNILKKEETCTQKNQEKVNKLINESSSKNLM